MSLLRKMVIAHLAKSAQKEKWFRLDLTPLDSKYRLIS